MTRLWVPVLGLAMAGIVSAFALSSAIAKVDEPNATVYTSPRPFVDGVLERKPVKGEAEYNQLFVDQTDFINSMFLGPILSPKIRAQIPHFIVSWLRNWLAAVVLYGLSGGGYYLWTFWWKKDDYFPKDRTLAKEPVLEQIIMALQGIPVLTLLPTLAEYFVEKGWTRSYVAIEEVGWRNWTIHVSAYLLFCEFWVYWFHRWLHGPLLYKWLHHTHHFYFRRNSISPFAGLVFNPIDGILQASPLVFALFVSPIHFPTYYILFFLEEIWSANIHDTVDGEFFGVLGAGYHNYHHSHYHYNYGHFTILMDWLFGTLMKPETESSKKQALKSS